MRADLVLMADEVRLLKQREMQGLWTRTPWTMGGGVVCKFLCEEGLAEVRDGEMKLSSLGHRLARKLIADGATGAVRIPGTVIETLSRVGVA
ncbi:hypothetical protein VT03_01040 [Planctomyces sp. SH-PL14]|nr:hypothetical protein VT03_01040 [Planctomyces sp. SH-PL14]